MVIGKKVAKGHFLRERLKSPSSLKEKGFTQFRTLMQDHHRVLLACLPGKRNIGRCKTQAVLHPKSER